MPRTVAAIRYVLPFREGGSVPALMEADDLGMYVVKLRGASQGAKVLVAELVAGELARAVGLDVPEIVFVELDVALADAERDPELAAPLERSAGLNLGLDFLPGSVTYDPAAAPPIDGALASRIVLFDAFVLNVDRTPRNANLLRWHRRHFLIDHGASLYFHHGWSAAAPLAGSDDPFAEVKDHVLLPRADALREASDGLAKALSPEVFARVTRDIPDAWLDHAFPDAAATRAAYGAWLEVRLEHLPAIVEEAERARRV